MPIKVEHKLRYKPLPGEATVYVGRPTPLGNPYSHKSGTLAKFKTNSREESIEKYGAWLQEHKHDKPVRDMLVMIYRLAETKTVVLLCWCAPMSCHADHIKALLE